MNKATQSAPPVHTVADVLGQIVWLMSQSKDHVGITVGSLEARIMPAILLNQFRIYKKENQPVACVIYARLKEPSADFAITPKTLEGWRIGTHAVAIDVISPFGDRDEIKSAFLREMKDRS